MISYSRHTLSNGLRLIHHFDCSSAMMALDVMYGVGARDESRDLTGMAHLFEHLMFGGSVNIPDFDAEVERAGGWNNAWTSNDFTNFYTVVPAINVETAFRLESDRMLALAFNSNALEVQRNVVVEEFKETCLNQPYGDLMHHLRKLVYRQHPYGWPTIGLDPEHIRKVTDEDVRRWFYSHYAPNNAVIAVTGGVPFDKAVELAEKWFGPIPRRELAVRHTVKESPGESPRSEVVYGPVPQTVIVQAWLMPGRGEKGYRECDLLSDVLSNGQSSRFYRQLLMGTDIFTEIDASIVGSEDTGMFLVQARLRGNGAEAERRAVEAIRGQIDALAVTGPTDHEVERAVNKFESAQTFGNLSYVMQAMNLAEAEITDTDIKQRIYDYRHTTASDIQRAAAEILRPDAACTLIYRPTEVEGSTLV